MKQNSPIFQCDIPLNPGKEKLNLQSSLNAQDQHLKSTTSDQGLRTKQFDGIINSINANDQIVADDDVKSGTESGEISQAMLIKHKLQIIKRED